MKLVLAIRGQTPPDNFRYTHAQDGHISQSLDEDSWLAAIAKHCTDNNYPTVSREDAIDQLCHLLPDGWCKYKNGTKPAHFVNTRIGVRDVLHGTKVLVSFIWDGMSVVSKELAASRSLTCSRCFYNVNTTGCAPCVGLSALAASIGGAIKTPSDASLRSCAVCRCALKAKTRLPIELIAKSTTAEQMQSYPDFCWLKNEMLTFQADANK